MTTINTASRQWATRPPEERFTSLTDLHEAMAASRHRSRSVVVSNRKLAVIPYGDQINEIAVTGPNGHPSHPSHWAFGQLSARAGAPAGFLRTLPAPIVADVLNYKLRFVGDPEDVGVLLSRDETGVALRAVTGPQYGRIFNAEITNVLLTRFGDGITGQWKVPGEFGRDVKVTKQNTTLYGSDRDMFVFLADEHNRIEVPNRRDGQPGTLSRGFFVWNSEVGAATVGIAFFLFDYVCSNRIVWGAEQYIERRIRHTASAPDRWIEACLPVLNSYSEASAKPIVAMIEAAQQHKLDDVKDFLAKRFTPGLAKEISAAYETDEGRPIETLYDVVTGLTAHARTVPYQADRVDLERQAGQLLDLAA